MGKKNAINKNELNRILSEIRNVGFCVVPSVLSPVQCREFRTIIRQIMREEKSLNLHPSGHQRILHLLMKNRKFTDLLCHPLVLAVWENYLGKDFICSTMTANVLWPDSTELYWHVDHPYWTMTQPYPIYPLTGQVIWMIDDFTVKNGATAGIAGSHRRPTLPKLGEEWTDEATILSGKSGSIILADGAWWHTSRHNNSRQTRIAVLNTYIRTYCVPQEDMRMQLETIKNPSDQVKQLLGGNQYLPRRDFPY